MTNEYDDKISVRLAKAVQELVQTPAAEELPTDLNGLVLRALSRADHSTLYSDSNAVTKLKGKYSMALLVKYSLAASLLIVVGAIAWLGVGGGINPVYGEVAERLARLESIVYRVQWVADAGLVNAATGDGAKVTHVVPAHDRIEQSNGSILIIDTEAGKAIDLNPATKKAVVMSGKTANNIAAVSRGPLPLLDTLRKHFRVGRTLFEGIDELAEKDFGGIRAKGLRSSVQGEIVEAWFDPATSLPLEVRICLVIPAALSSSTDQATHMWRVMTAFEFDVAVDPSLLSVKVPSGYTVVQMPELLIAKNAAGPTLTDLIDLLRICAEHNDSTFPASLSMDNAPGTCMDIMRRYANAQDKAAELGTDAEKQEAITSAMEFGSKLGRAMPFLFSLRLENKLRYVGAGVKLGAADRPILWFSPKSDTQFQVVYADLSVQEVSEAALPLVAEAAKSTLEERTEIRSTSPRVILPESAIKDYKALQSARKTRLQDETRFIELQWMPEFMQNSESPDSKDDPDSSRLKFLEEFPNLEGLKVDDLSLTENDLKCIGQCHKLKKLSLSGVQVVDSSRKRRRLQGTDLRHLSDLKNLEMLDLSQSDFSGGLQHLGALPILNILILSSFENLNDASVAQLKHLPHLQTLVLSPVYGTNAERTVTDAGLESLKNLPSLRTLYIGYHGKWTAPVEKLQSILPKVKVEHGFLEQKSTGAGVSPPPPIKARKQ